MSTPTSTPAPFIAVEGPIGVGKTTLARLLQPLFGAGLLLEVFEENPFLAAFYGDRARYAFQTQLFFLLSRYRHQHAEVPAALLKGPLVSDYIFAKDRLFAELNLTGDELALYESVHVALAERVRVPDVVVYLRANLATLLARIAFRDRSYERNMDGGYIETLAHAYDRFFATYSACPVLEVDTTDRNFLVDAEAVSNVAAQVRVALTEGLYQGRLPLL
ncbi:MAG: deoxynucleoside kinase [Anaerolineae bacterium]